MIAIQVGGFTYGWSQEAFARRVINIAASRNWRSPADAIAGISALAFTAGGWLQLKKALAEIVVGSVIWPSDFDPAFPQTPTLVGGLTEAGIGTRDISSTIT